MISYTRQKIERLLKIEFVRFCIVGGIGFLINLALLLLLTKDVKFPIPLAQFLGAEAALFSNFLLHHNWTYKERQVKKKVSSLLLQFHLSSWPAIIGSTLMVSIGVDVLKLSKLDSLIISSAIALLWNFFWTRFVIWKGVTSNQIEKIADES